MKRDIIGQSHPADALEVPWALSVAKAVQSVDNPLLIVCQ